MEYLKTKNKRTLILICLVFIVSVYSLIQYATATEPTNIKAEYKFAWSENGGWFNFGSGDGGVMVADSSLTGYIWSENLGWISLNCSNNNSCATSDYKVSNDSEGNLSGYAWGENIGWVNFAPTNGGVHIDSLGEFSGYAWSENTGWIVFNCQDLDVCAVSDFKVRTTWLPLSVRNQNESDEEEQEGVEVSDVHYSSTDTTIVINWETNHNADSHVRWGNDKNLEKEKNDNENEKKHRVVLRDLDPDTEYYFRAKSTDKNDNSDSSKIYSLSTKKPSAIFAKRQWDKNDEVENDDKSYEKVEIDVTDKTDKEIQKDEKNKTKEISEIKIPEQKPSLISKFFSSVRNGVSGFFSAVHDLALNTQRKVIAFFDWTGDQIASAYDSVVSRFNKEKANEIARLNQAKFFTTQVFSRDEKKMLAEVRFQILDRSDNPVPNLETMLFSDPQTSVTDDNGIASFKDVPLGSHTLAFDYQGENFEKKVAIADTLTDEGKVRAEVVQVKAEKEKISVWMWGIMVLLLIAISVAIYFARKYYRLKNHTKE